MNIYQRDLPAAMLSLPRVNRQWRSVTQGRRHRGHQNSRWRNLSSFCTSVSSRCESEGPDGTGNPAYDDAWRLAVGVGQPADRHGPRGRLSGRDRLERGWIPGAVPARTHTGCSALNVDNDYPRAVAATWSVSTALLDEDAAEIFKLCAFFSPEPIAEELFLGGGRNVQAPRALRTC